MSKKKNEAKKVAKKEVKINENEKLEKKVTKQEVKLEKEIKTENKKEIKADLKEEKVPTTAEEKAITKKIKRVSNDKIIIFSIIASVILITAGIFGYYFYNTSLKPIATFDGGTLTTSEYTVYYKTFAPMLQYYGYKEAEIPEQIAKKAATDKIILKMAKDAGVTLSDADRAKVEETFSKEETLEQFKTSGVDIPRLKQLYQNDYIISAYIEKLKKDVGDDKVLEYIKTTVGETADLNEYNTRHILIKLTDASGAALSDEKKAEAKAKAEGLLQKALAGENFEQLAKDNSEDTGTKEDGGKFAVYMDDSVMKAYSEATKTMKAGEIHATLVETEAGYHIIKLENIVENGRKNNPKERETIVNADVDKINETKNVKINTDVLNKLVEKLTGKAVPSATDETNSNPAGATITETTPTTNESGAGTTTEATPAATPAQ